MPRPVYSFLALDEHPYACEMLRQLLDAGFPPRELVLERSELAHVEREKFLERIAGHPPAPSLTEQAAAHGIPVHSMPLHASEPLLELIGHAPLDLVVLDTPPKQSPSLLRLKAEAWRRPPRPGRSRGSTRWWW